MNEYLESVSEEKDLVCCELSLDGPEAIQLILLAKLDQLNKTLQDIAFSLREGRK